MMLPTTNRVVSACMRQGIPLLAVVLLAGCSENERTSVVSGKVTLDGAAVPAGVVLFMPDDGQAAGVELQSDGSYTLNCHPGSFKVSVNPPPPTDDPLANAAAATSAGGEIPQRYFDFSSSGLTIEVKEGASTFDIPLTSKSTTE